MNHRNKHESCKFFLDQQNGPALLGMPNIEALDILTINYNIISRQTSQKYLSKKQMHCFYIRATGK